MPIWYGFWLPNAVRFLFTCERIPYKDLCTFLDWESEATPNGKVIVTRKITDEFGADSCIRMTSAPRIWKRTWLRNAWLIVGVGGARVGGVADWRSNLQRPSLPDYL